MIAKVAGVLAEVGEDRVLVDRDGLGYEVLVPAYLSMQLSDRVGQPVTLYTMDYLEGSATSGNLIPRLAGFGSDAEKAAFQQLLGVKGFGVRKALKALAVPIAQVAAAIEQGDTISLRACRASASGRPSRSWRRFAASWLPSRRRTRSSAGLPRRRAGRRPR